MNVNNRAAGIIGLLVGLSVLGGCATIDAPRRGDRELLWQQHHRKIAAIDAWQLRGKIAVKSARKSGGANLIWDHQPPRRRIELYGPFGSGRVRIDARAENATIQDAKGNTIQAADADAALHQTLGWRAPFAQLHYWARGIPSAEDASDGANDKKNYTYTLDAAGRLATLRQGGWRIEYLSYRAVGRWQLPRKLVLTAAPGVVEIYSRAGDYLGDQLRVTLIVRAWRDVRVDE